MNKLYLALMQRLAKRTLSRQPEMDILMLDRSQNAEFTRDGEDGSLAIIYDLVVNAILRLSPSSGRGLDICCGSASLLCKVASALPQFDFLGVDLSDSMLQFARENRDRYELKNLRFKRGDMYNLAQVAEPPYDLITWHLAMHHCTDQDAVVRVLNQIPQLLKPGGTLFVFDINRPKTGDLALMIADTFNRTQGDWFYQDSLDSYKAAFSYEEVEEILKKANLKNVQHVEPSISNLFQAFYISSVDNRSAAPVANLRHFWQKVDYAMIKSSFPALPLAMGHPRKQTLKYERKTSASDQGSRIEIDNGIIEILDIGTRAMSAYNLQPWRFRVDGENVFVHFIRLKNFFLKLEGVYYMMVGHLLTNILAAAQAKGYRVDYEILSEALSVDEPCVKLRFSKVQQTPCGDLSAVRNRVTNRYPFSTRKLPPEIKKQILSLYQDPNIEIRFVEDKAKNHFAQMLADLENVRLQNASC